MRWTETMSLRFVKRNERFILQQKWAEVLYPNDRRSPKTEWRDVPLEDET